MQPIATLHSPFVDKFGLPRQPGLISACEAYIELLPPFNSMDYVRGLEAFSHIWLIFQFHQHKDKPHKALVRPPRLGGNDKVGVFSTRASYRPNNLGMSVVKLHRIEVQGSRILLFIACPDLIHGTPILDIKPYIAYSDCVTISVDSFADKAPEETLSIRFSDRATSQLALLADKPYGDHIEMLIRETLRFDPRPAYKPDKDEKEYAIRLYDLDIKWRVIQGEALVEALVKLPHGD
jgi:tRNA-Thr(GGU) m(6)t(6)A37 methyltransferase TsaA